MSSHTNQVPDTKDRESGAANPPQAPNLADVSGSEDVESDHNPPPIPELSEWSTSAIAPSAWCSTDFLVGVGMVIIQQKTQKIAVVYSSKLKYWFFPRGRKDVGESLETAALREAHEESGYRAEFLPLMNPTNQPSANRPKPKALNTEPIYMTTNNWQPGRSGVFDHGGVYLTTWFAGQIPENATYDADRIRMPDEHDFETHLLPYDEVLKRIWGSEINVLRYVWAIYQHTLRELQLEADRRAEQRRRLHAINNRKVHRP